MRVLHATPEYFPLAKAGGLGDVSAALPAAQALAGIESAVVLPGLPAVKAGLLGLHALGPLELPRVGLSATLLSGLAPNGVPVFVPDLPRLFDRPGGPYLDPYGRDWPDSGLRWGAFAEAAALIACGAAPMRWQADVLHCHDWAAGPAALHLALGPRPRPASVFTIHNIAYGGLFPPDLAGRLGLPAQVMDMHGAEFHGRFGFLKAGLYFADMLSTVSPTYAREIQSEPGAWGYGGLLSARADRLVGIVNGIDTRVWDPATDPLLPERYDARRLAAKALNRLALRERLGLDRAADGPVFGIVSRLVELKGLHLLVPALEALLAEGGTLALLGSGEPWLEGALHEAARRHPGRVAVTIGYDETLAHLIVAGADILVMPSLGEPCGLTQLYAMRYGTVPLVRRTGGLADTVVPAGWTSLDDGSATGIAFDDPSPEALAGALAQAHRLWRDPWAWPRLQQAAMARDPSWAAAMPAYRRLYAEALAQSDRAG